MLAVGDHLSRGAPELEDNILFMDLNQPDKDGIFMQFCKSIESSAGYKNFTDEGNAIIIKIPKEDFQNISKITYYDGGQNVLKKEYIFGYVSTSKDDMGNVTFKDLIYSNNSK